MVSGTGGLSQILLFFCPDGNKEGFQLGFPMQFWKKNQKFDFLSQNVFILFFKVFEFSFFYFEIQKLGKSKNIEQFNKK